MVSVPKERNQFSIYRNLQTKNLTTLIGWFKIEKNRQQEIQVRIFFYFQKQLTVL